MKKYILIFMLFVQIVQAQDSVTVATSDKINNLIKTGDYKSAVELADSVLRTSPPLDEKQAAFMALGIINEHQERYQEALKFYRLALDLNGKYSHNVYGNLVVLFARQQQWDSAIVYANLQLASLPKRSTEYFTAIGNLAVIYSQINRFKEAEILLKDAIQNADKRNLGLLYSQRGDISFYQGKNREALKDYFLAEKFPSTAKTRFVICQAIADTYRALNNCDSALFYKDMSIAINDSINQIKYDERIGKLQNEISFKEAKHETEILKEKVERQLVYEWIGAGAFIIAMIIIWIIHRLYASAKRSHAIIEEQKRIIEEKQKDLIASIRYAQRIQTSLLPTQSYLEKNLSRLQNETHQ